MAETIVCPTCGKRFVAKPELVGRRVRCRGCGEPFLVGAEETRATFDVAGPDEPPVAAAPPMPPPLPTRSPAWRGHGGGRSHGAWAGASKPAAAGDSWALSEGERGWLKVCGGVVLFGIVGAILPLFGLELRKLANIEGNPSLKALGVSVAGVVFALLMFVRKVIKRSAKAAWRTMGLWGVGAAAGLILVSGLVVVLVGAAPWSTGRRLAVPRIAVGSTPTRTPLPPWPPPPPTQAPMTYESLVERFGAERVVRVRARGLSGSKDPTHQRIREAFKQVKATNWRGTHPADTADSVAAPVADFDEFVRALGPGPEVAVDRAARSVAIDLAARRPAE